MDDPISKDLLNILQREFPLAPNPFQVMADKLDLTEDQVLERVAQFKKDRLIRQISPIYDTRSLGYDSSLVAFELGSEDLRDKAAIVSAHPGVSHNYERPHRFNLWYTLAVPPDSRVSLDETVDTLARMTGSRAQAILRTTQVFKIGVKLNLKGKSNEREQHKHKGSADTPLTEQEREIVKITQRDLDLVPRPFQAQAEALNISETELIDHLKDFINRRVMRRFAAILFHRKAGFRANGMSVWQVPKERVDSCGLTLASFKAVSHCYERTCSNEWPYNVFAMIHGKSRDEVEGVVAEMEQETGLKDPLILYSTREFKKQRIEYFSDEFRDWEDSVLASR
jgi:DNA-binding Lrp family transcriptional regulator